MSKARPIRKILVTGGAGFIGSEFVRQNVANGTKIAVVDKLTYAGDLSRLASVRKHINFYLTDICDARRMGAILQREKPDCVVHFAAETHVDRSILNAHPFIATNVTGTQTLVNLILKNKIKRFVHISTDEVYGEIARGRFTEKARLNPGNPYSASKAAADLLIKAAIRTFGLPAIIVRPSNNYGPWQYPEKLVPVIILKALKGQKVPVYGRGQHVREWLYVADCADGITHVMQKGKVGEVYNISSYIERPNIVTVRALLKLLGKSAGLIQFVKDRPGHDIRYALNCQKIRARGWKPKVGFQEGMAQTVDWNKEHLVWLESKLAFLQNYWRKVYR